MFVGVPALARAAEKARKHDPGTPSCEVLQVAHQLVATRLLQVAAQPLDPVGRTLGQPGSLLTIALVR